MFSTLRAETTLREFLLSIGIILLCIAGLVAGTFGILDYHVGINERYQMAREIETSEMFNYYHNVNIGDAFTYADLNYVDSVKDFPEITDNYSYISREEEKYTKHTETHTYTDDDGNTHTYTTTYWSWDSVKTITKKSKQVDFNGIIIDASLVDTSYYAYDLDLSDINFGETLNDQKYKKKESKYVYTTSGWDDYRYHYTVVGMKLSGAAFVSLEEDTIKPAEGSTISFHKDTTVAKVKDNTMKSPAGWIVLLWVGGIFFTGIIVVCFYLFENKWLH